VLRASVGSTEAAKDVVARVGVVGPTRASFDSDAHNPDIGASDPRNRRSTLSSSSDMRFLKNLVSARP
jgi:hypothetical protein